MIDWQLKREFVLVLLVYGRESGRVQTNCTVDVYEYKHTYI